MIMGRKGRMGHTSNVSDTVRVRFANDFERSRSFLMQQSLAMHKFKSHSQTGESHCRLF